MLRKYSELAVFVLNSNYRVLNPFSSPKPPVSLSQRGFGAGVWREENVALETHDLSDTWTTMFTNLTLTFFPKVPLTGSLTKPV